VGPTVAECSTTVSAGPIVAHSDALCTDDKKVADTLMKVADERQMSPQAAVLGVFQSDASHAKAIGIVARAGMLAIPTLSTHGYEVIHREGIPAMAEILVEDLLGGGRYSRRTIGQQTFYPNGFRRHWAPNGDHRHALLTRK
jgi:putative aminopeptidase FrvX